jgi:5-formyltetrahydrofolate cyclo-ligase
MGKKSRAQYTSKGQRRNVSKWVRKQARKETTPLQRTLNQQAAFRKGKNVMVTIPNPSKTETNKPFIRVSAKEIWKSPKPFIMSQNTGDGV